MGNIDNKVAIVTGGGGGIGGAIVQRFAREGAKLAVADINPEAAHARVKEVADRGTDAMAITSDVTNKNSVQAMVKATLDRWGKIDILVNVAGGAQRKNVVDMSAEDWDRIVNMNLKSVFLCSQAVLPTMLKAKYGKIVSISSIYGFAGNATRSSYAAAKAGVAVFTKSLALEHVKDGLNINAIAPGRITTARRARPLLGRSLGRRRSADPHGPRRQTGKHRQRGELLGPGRERLHHRPDHSRKWRLAELVKITEYVFFSPTIGPF